MEVNKILLLLKIISNILHRIYRPFSLYKFNFFDTIRVFYPDSQQSLAVGPHTKIFIWYVSNPYCNRSFLFNSDRFCTYNLWNFYWTPYGNFVLLRYNFFKLFIYSQYFGSIVYYSYFIEFLSTAGLSFYLIDNHIG